MTFKRPQQNTPSVRLKAAGPDVGNTRSAPGARPMHRPVAGAPAGRRRVTAVDPAQAANADCQLRGRPESCHTVLMLASDHPAPGPKRTAMSQLDRNTVTQFLSPGQRLLFAWRTCADEPDLAA
jgi:hypothetical protein